MCQRADGWPIVMGGWDWQSTLARTRDAVALLSIAGNLRSSCDRILVLGEKEKEWHLVEFFTRSLGVVQK